MGEALKLQLAGAVLLVFGVGIVAPWLAMIVAGVFLLLFGLAAEREDV